jgi:hypothetical protein
MNNLIVNEFVHNEISEWIAKSNHNLTVVRSDGNLITFHTSFNNNHTVIILQIPQKYPAIKKGHTINTTSQNEYFYSIIKIMNEKLNDKIVTITSILNWLSLTIQKNNIEIEHTSYHHGEQSLRSTVEHMVQRYTENNKSLDIQSPKNECQKTSPVQKQLSSESDDDGEMSEKEIDKLYDGKSIFANRTVQHRPIIRKKQVSSESDDDGEMSEKEIDKLYDGKSIFANRTIQHRPANKKPVIKQSTNLLEILKSTHKPITVNEPLKVHEPITVDEPFSIRKNIIGANMIKTELLSCIDNNLISYSLINEKNNSYNISIHRNFFNKECDLFKFLNEQFKVHLTINFGNDYPNIDKLTIVPFKYPCVGECVQKIKSKWNFNSNVSNIFDEIKTSLENIKMIDMEK